MSAVTEAEAQSVLEAVRTQFTDFNLTQNVDLYGEAQGQIEAQGCMAELELLMDHPDFGYPVVMWEAGPYEWTLSAFEESMVVETGERGPRGEIMCDLVELPEVKLPPGIFVEPYNGYTLAISKTGEQS